MTPNFEKALAALQIRSADEVNSDFGTSPLALALARRAALVRVFDRETFTSVLAAGLQGGTDARLFDDFVARPGVERIPRTKGLFRLRDSTRQQQRAAWTGRRDERAAYARTLAQHFAARAEHDPLAKLDWLESLLWFDASSAHDAIVAIYREADERFDLPFCQTLLRTVEAQEAELDDRMRQTLRDTEVYYQSRALFVPEYYQTTSYYSRDSLAAPFRAVLEHPSKWIFHLFATGGMGKTMFVRWAAARHCVVRPQRIPVARLDFDYVHLPLVLRYPWLLLQPIAAQLNEQIPGRPFHELLEGTSGLREFAPLLQQLICHEPRQMIASEDDALDEREHGLLEAQRRERAQAEAKLASSDAFWSQFAVTRFAEILEQTSLAGPVLIILDTLEEMSRAHAPTLLSILAQLASAHQRCPKVRLLLAGRYDLRESVKGFGLDYLTQSECREAGRFTLAETHEYLGEKRRVGDAKLRDAIHERADGNPFKLALFADLVSARQAAGQIVTSGDVHRLPSADFAYLIERIVERIPELAVRWVLRYGVVPRRLTREFFEQVMRAHLQREIEASELDQPNRFPEHARAYEGRPVWLNQSPESQELSTSAVWERLRQYASSYGWIAYEERSDSYLFHPEVRVPMCELLAHNEVFEALQRDAVNYFERRAAAAPERGWDARSEVVYHLSRFDGARALAYWEALIGASAARRTPQARRTLATTMIELADDPAWTGIDDALRAQARTTALTAAAECSIVLAAQRANRSPEWAMAATYFGKLAPATVLGPPASELQRLAELVSGGGVSEPAAAAMHALAEREVASDLRLSLHLHLIDDPRERASGAAEAHYRAAIELTSQDGPALVPNETLRGELADFLASRERFVAAEREYRAALAVEDVPAARRHALLLQLGRLYCDHGQASRAEEAIAPVTSANDTGEAGARAKLMRAEIALGQGDPVRAVSELRFVDDVADPFGRNFRASCLEVLGQAHSELFAFERAASHLEQAKSHWIELNDTEAENRCRLRLFELHFFGTGNLKESSEYLREWRKPGARRPSEIELRLQLMDAAWTLRRHGPAQARPIFERTRALAWVTASPRLRSLMLATGLALGLAQEADARELVLTLGALEPNELRLRVVEPFRCFASANGSASNDLAWHTRSKPERAVRDELLLLFDWVGRDPASELDHVAHGLSTADLFGWLDAPARAGEVLRGAWHVARRTGNAAAQRAVLDAVGRCPDLDPEHEFGRVDSEGLGAWPLRTAVLVERCERFDREGRILAAQDDLIALRSLVRDAAPSQWMARFLRLEARLGMGAGDPANARERLELAHQLYLGLDDPASGRHIERDLNQAAALARSMPHDGPRPTAPDSVPSGAATSTALLVTGVDAERCVMRFDVLGGDPLEASALALQVEPPRASPFALIRQTLVLESEPPGQWLRMVMRAGAASMSELARQLGDQVDLALRMSEVLLSTQTMRALFEAAAFHGGLELRLSMPPSPLAALPWEAARLAGPFAHASFQISRTTPQTAPARATVQWLQAAANLLQHRRLVVDGIEGPATREAILSLQVSSWPEPAEEEHLFTRQVAAIRRELSRSSSPAPTVLLVQSRTATALRGVRGFASRYIEDLYGSLGFEVHTLTSNPEQFLQSALQSVTPQIIHLVTSLSESARGSEASLDLGGSDRRRSTLALTASWLSGLLAHVRGWTNPLVVLDVIQPSSPTEALRQLLLRNQFAAQLFHHENTGGVLATGLMPPDTNGDALRVVLSGFRAGGSIGEAVESARRLQRDTDSGMHPMALFTLDPALSVIGRPRDGSPT